MIFVGPEGIGCHAHRGDRLICPRIITRWNRVLKILSLSPIVRKQSLRNMCFFPISFVCVGLHPPPCLPPGGDTAGGQKNANSFGYQLSTEKKKFHRLVST